MDSRLYLSGFVSRFFTKSGEDPIRTVISKGFNWKLEEPNDLDPEQFKDLKNLTVKLYKVTLGRLEKNGKTFFQLQGKEFVKGEMKVNFDIPLVF